jgi:hypothetical protein
MNATRLIGMGYRWDSSRNLYVKPEAFVAEKHGEQITMRKVLLARDRSGRIVRVK